MPHVDPVDMRLGCFGSDRLVDRSFVVNSDVTTLKGHSICNYNLDMHKPSAKGIDLYQEEVDPYMGCIY